MSFVKTIEEISDYQPNGEFYDAEVLTVYFETNPEVVEKLLPSPLKPAALPIGAAFVAKYPKTNFGVTYLESALFLLAQHNGEEGAYCLSMPVTNDIALILGREIFGYPKKMAEIGFDREENNIRGWTERHGIRFMEIKAKLNGKFNDVSVQQMMADEMESNPDVTVYNFKYFPAPDREGFDYSPRLVKEVVKRKNKTIEMGEAELAFQASEHDPWVDVEIVRVYGATYTVGDNTMLPGNVVAEADQVEFAPFAFMKLDAI
jgi:acetoacetate decarboxylase